MSSPTGGYLVHVVAVHQSSGGSPGDGIIAARDEEPGGRPLAHERGGEASEGLRDHDRVGPVAERVEDGARVRGQGGRVVVGRQVRRQRVVASRPEPATTRCQYQPPSRLRASARTWRFPLHPLTVRAGDAGPPRATSVTGSTGRRSSWSSSADASDRARPLRGHRSPAPAGDVPVAGEHEVLVRVRAAGLHPDVWHTVHGVPFALRLMSSGLRRPKQRVPGTDLAGVVESVGPGATRFVQGDEVFGETLRANLWRNGGTYAEFATVHEDLLESKPARLSFEEAAAVPNAADRGPGHPRRGRVRAGQRVPINGAGGGVGRPACSSRGVGRRGHRRRREGQARPRPRAGSDRGDRLHV